MKATNSLEGFVIRMVVVVSISVVDEVNSVLQSYDKYFTVTIFKSIKIRLFELLTVVITALLDGVLPRGGGSEDEAEELGGGAGDVVGVVVEQLVQGAEAPGDAAGFDAGAARGLHVDAGIADIQHFRFRGGGFR